jgi:hypothetical protein
MSLMECRVGRPRMYIEVHNELDSRKVFFIHGMGGRVDQFRGQIEHLQRLGVGVCAFDLVGMLVIVCTVIVVVNRQLLTDDNKR